jgi:hypothetical protein
VPLSSPFTNRLSLRDLGRCYNMLARDGDKLHHCTKETRHRLCPIIFSANRLHSFSAVSFAGHQRVTLSGALLRLFKFRRECQRNLDRVNHVNACNKTVYMHGAKVIILDTSFRDDLRLFCAWSGSSELRPAMGHETARIYICDK